MTLQCLVEIIGTMAGGQEFWPLLFFKRGITPVGLPGNVYSGVLEKRLWLIIKPQALEEQCGFHPGHGMVEQLFTL